MTSPHVDYDVVASRYAVERSVSTSTVALWSPLVSPLVRQNGRALDLGSGVGGFSGALRDWGARVVYAVEPSASMRSRAPREQGVVSLAGRAEEVPLKSASTDFVWISTAIHHFRNKELAIDECRRVLAHEGRIAIRGFVPGHSRLRWLEQFPGLDKAIARFPTLEELTATFSRAGLRPIHDQVVSEGSRSFAHVAQFVERMRHADSLLTALSDEDVAAGVAALVSYPNERTDLQLSLLVYGD